MATSLKLSLIWIATMLMYLLGDILRIFSGDYEKDSSKFKKEIGNAGWFGISIVMVIPILMILFSVLLPENLSRIINLTAAAFFFIFNLIGLPTYPSLYDKFLIVVGLVLNVLTFVTALNWVI